MRMRGIDESQLSRLQAPAGPDAGAKTPGEIALVAIVGVLALLRGRSQVSVNAGQVKPEAVQVAGHEGHQPGSRTAPGKAAEGQFINPVCGIAVSIANPMHIEKYAGVSYYFCCDGCWTTFQKILLSMRRFTTLPWAGFRHEKVQRAVGRALRLMAHSFQMQQELRCQE
jgi:YHS domain-containing protein